MVDVRAFRLASLGGGVLVVALLAAPAQAAAPVSASATASATVVNSLVVVPDLDLAFGLLKGGSAAGSATVRPQGVRFVTGTSTMVGSGPCHTEFCEDDISNNNPQSASYWGPGRFQVSGSPNTAYRVTMPASATAYLRTPASGRMPLLQVTNFVALTNSLALPDGVLDSLGKDSVRIGGTINLPAGMKTGSYRVSIPISVAYN